MAYKDKTKGGGGRFFVYKPDHPRCSKNGSVKRAILVMEEHLGRYLNPLTEVVHHINGDVADDRLENLEVKTREEHSSYHHAGLPKPKKNGNSV